MYIYIYIYIHNAAARQPGRGAPKRLLHDSNLYTTTNKCLQCLVEIMYTVF